MYTSRSRTARTTRTASCRTQPVLASATSRSVGASTARTARIRLDADDGAVEDGDRLAAGPVVAPLAQRELDTVGEDAADSHGPGILPGRRGHVPARGAAAETLPPRFRRFRFPGREHRR